MKFNYPKANRDETYETYKSSKNGEVKIEDPYRWLETPTSEETKQWVNQENTVTRSFLDSDDLSKKFVSELTERISFPKYGFHVRRNDLLFYSKNPGLLNQSIVYLQDTKTKQEMVFLDPNSYSSDGTWSLSKFTVSKNAKYVAVGYSKGGSDWVTFQIFKVPTTVGPDSKVEVLDDLLEWTKFSSIEWTDEEDGFFYTRFQKPQSLGDSDKGTEADENKFQKLYYHHLGWKQSDDLLVFESKENPDWMFSANFTDDYQYLLIYISRDCNPEHNLSIIKNWRNSIKKLETFKIYEIVSNFEGNFSYLTNIGNRFIMHTNYKAPMNRLISFDIPDLDKQSSSVIPFESWAVTIKDFVAERPYLMESVGNTLAKKIYVTWLKDVQNQVEVYSIDGVFLHNVELPCPGTISVFGCSSFHNHIYMAFESFIYPKVIFYINSESNDDKLTIHVEPQIKNFSSQDYTCRQVFFKSKDQTEDIPMFIVHKKDLILNGQAPTLMLGYGGFNISYAPYFSIYNMYFVDKFNGIFVVANIRGGGEKGKSYHEAGTKERKQNVFDDFISAAEYLIANNYTSKDKLVINGGSNGGLLMGAVSNQRPDLFKGVVCEVGVLDMLRFHKFTIGVQWCSDYGCSDKPEEFDYLIKYSPLHNVPSSTTVYPSFLCLTGDHDDRVVPAHSYKFMAELQHQLSTKVDTPLLLLVDVNSGHGAGKPQTKYTQKYSDILNFISKTLSIPIKF
ncbi:prolyl oligopeptidase [Tieghemostelium lacteum]|uniref:Prolyl endopeptidase n=1 Tax=Tieghemostelium lacteum TaxID=361077 RepID=A0A152A2T1_TIELA|nr:prolyl oligopeptidase [Tieghemostelium lacteum]|eukprot:KYR00405.1 prolyl oligopeptidase [Tieghemostelium lacteum]